MKTVAALDQGTTSSRAILFGEDTAAPAEEEPAEAEDEVAEEAAPAEDTAE